MICEKEKCTGCYACYNICPKNAINMKEDENGFIYPDIDYKKCINCGLCKRTCPSNNLVEKKEPIKCYAGYCLNEDIRIRSTSGGICTIISKIFVKNKGIVYGAAFDNDCNVNHIRIENEKDIVKIQGSKYTQSYINNAYSNIKKDLINNKRVLFIGTPCQVAGLKKYLNKGYNNLYLIDIICHGVPSQKYLIEEVDRVVGNKKKNKIVFRDNNNYIFKVLYNNDEIYNKSIDKSPYVDAFMNGLSLRDNCHNCMYANRKRISDLTIGDFWGLKNDSSLYHEKEKGINTIICTTSKGIELIDLISNFIRIEERNYQESVSGNSQLTGPVNKYNISKKFKKDYIKYGFIKAYKKNSKRIRIRRFCSKIKKVILND